MFATAYMTVASEAEIEESIQLIITLSEAKPPGRYTPLKLSEKVPAKVSETFRVFSAADESESLSAPANWSRETPNLRNSSLVCFAPEFFDGRVRRNWLSLNAFRPRHLR